MVQGQYLTWKTLKTALAVSDRINYAQWCPIRPKGCNSFEASPSRTSKHHFQADLEEAWIAENVFVCLFDPCCCWTHLSFEPRLMKFSCRSCELQRLPLLGGWSLDSRLPPTWASLAQRYEVFLFCFFFMQICFHKFVVAHCGTQAPTAINSHIILQNKFDHILLKYLFSSVFQRVGVDVREQILWLRVILYIWCHFEWCICLLIPNTILTILCPETPRDICILKDRITPHVTNFFRLRLSIEKQEGKRKYKSDGAVMVGEFVCVYVCSSTVSEGGSEWGSE